VTKHAISTDVVMEIRTGMAALLPRHRLRLQARRDNGAGWAVT